MKNLQRIGLVAVFGVAATVFALGAWSRFGRPERSESLGQPAAGPQELAAGSTSGESRVAAAAASAVRGRVTNADGSAAGLADVVLLDADLEPTRALEASAEGESEGVVGRAVADADGVFTVDVDEALARVQLVARGDGGCTLAPLVVTRGPDGFAHSEVVLARAADLVIESAPSGQLVVRADATEGAVQARGTPIGTRRIDHTRGTPTVVRGLAPGVALELVALPTTSASARLRVAPLVVGERRTIVLPDRTGDTFAGRVVDGERRGVAEALVVLTWPNEPGRRGDEIARAVTDAEGVFAIERVPPDELIGEVRTDTHAPLQFWVPQPGTRRSSGGFVLELGAGARLEGLVLAADGTPAVGAAVEVEVELGETPRAGTSPTRTATTDANGRFEALGLEGRVFKVAVRLAVDGRPVERAVARAVEPGVPVAITLVETVALEVDARRPDGTPIERLEIAGRLMDARTTLQTPGQKFATTSTAVDGRHRVDGLLPGAWQFDFAADGLAPFDEIALVLPRAQPLRLDFELGAAISGRVVAPSGEPLQGARVLARSARPAVGTARDEEREADITDADGRFELYDLRAGSLHLSARHAGFANSEWREVVVDAGQRLGDVELEVRTGARLTGRVLSADDVPQAGRWVVCHSVESWDPVRVRTDALGEFQVDALAPGECQIFVLGLEDEDPGKVSVDELAMAHVELVDGATHHVEIGGSSATGVDFAGVVEFAPAGRVNWLQVRRDGDGALAIARVADDGSFSTRLAAPGRHLVSVVIDKGVERGLEFALAVDVPTERNQPLVVEGASGVIAGRVTDANGNGVAGVQVRLEPHGVLIAGSALQANFAFDVTGDDGRFRFAKLTAGEYRVTAGGQTYSEGAQARARWSAATEAGLQLAANEAREDVVLVVGEPRSVSGEVVDGDGRPLADAAVHAWTETGGFVHEIALVHTDAEGRFEYEGLPSGDVRFRAYTGEFASAHLVPAVDGRVRIETLASGSLVVEHVCPSGGVLSLLDEDGVELAGLRDLRKLARVEGQLWFAGRQVFEGLAPGRYTVALRAVDGRVETKHVQVARGEQRRVVLTVR
jgi:protocatechuate 3,4-dioxygenase beta subunit